MRSVAFVGRRFGMRRRIRKWQMPDRWSQTGKRFAPEVLRALRSAARVRREPLGRVQMCMV